MATYIIAEAGVNHNGDLRTALLLVEAAASAGASAVKFQTFNSSLLASDTAPQAKYQQQQDPSSSQVEMLQRLELKLDDWKTIATHAASFGIDFISTPFGIEEYLFLTSLSMRILKIPSGEITNLPYLHAVSKYALSNSQEIFLSTGMCSLGEVEQALSIILSTGFPASQISILHCTSAYPAPPSDLNLRAISTLSGAFKCRVGYSDHSQGLTASIIAVALGATIIEKHITLDKSQIGPDHVTSLEPSEFTQLVFGIRTAESMLGTGVKQPVPSEMDTRNVARRSLHAARDIAANQIISQEDLQLLRPGYAGLPPSFLDLVVGMRTTRSFAKGDPIVLK